MARVLVVDDARFMRTMLRNILTENGHEVVGEAENGKTAIEQFKNLHPDVIMLDITMPDMSGIDVLKEIKSINKYTNVIMCSAMGQKSFLYEAIENGAIDFIVKPFEEERVVKALRRIS